jgi:glycosyltransferase involved in cell wall biosynthesis
VRLAWFTPFSAQSAIGNFSQIVLRELQKHAEVVLFASDIATPRDARSHEFDLQLLYGRSSSSIAASLVGFDRVIYNLGNHYEMHHRTYEVALRAPGLVVLHDLVMHHMFAGRYLGKNADPDGYLNELQFAHGESGRALGRRILSGEAGPLVWDSPIMLEFHMARSAVRGSLGVIVHSRFAQSAVASVASAPVAWFPFPTPENAMRESSTPRAENERLRLLTIGLVNRNKMVEEVVRCIGTSDVLRQKVVYQVAGDSASNVSYHQRLLATIQELRLENVVQLLGYQPDAVLHETVADADLVINLRNPHFGEGSWSLLETAYAGKPTVVWRHGFYDEFPDDTVAKVATLDELRTVLERLCNSSVERTERGLRTREYARRTFVTANYARRLLEFHTATRYNAPALQLADFVVDGLRRAGVVASDHSIIDRLAREVANVTNVSDASDALPGPTEEWS